MKEKITKAKTKAKKKVAAKVGKVAKTAVKAASVAALVASVAGCAATGEQPARAQIQRNDFKGCYFYVTAPSPDGTPGVELFTQTQANEGSETISPTASPRNDTALDLSPNVAYASPNSSFGAKGAKEAKGDGAKSSSAADMAKNAAKAVGDKAKALLNGEKSEEPVSDGAANTEQDAEADCSKGECEE